jgi:hypothetical protein
MSDDDYFYDDSSSESQEQAPIEQAPQAPTVSYEQFQALQQQLQELQSNPLKQMGYERIQQQSNRFDPSDPNVRGATEFLQAQGVMTREAYRAERCEELAVENGYVSEDHLVSTFKTEYFGAKDPIAKAELQKIDQLYLRAPAQAIKEFKSYLDKKSSNIPQNQSYGHVPNSNNQAPSQNGTQFNSMEEFNSFRRNNPVKGEEYMRRWMQSGNPPFKA